MQNRDTDRKMGHGQFWSQPNSSFEEQTILILQSRLFWVVTIYFTVSATATKFDGRGSNLTWLLNKKYTDWSDGGTISISMFVFFTQILSRRINPLEIKFVLIA